MATLRKAAAYTKKRTVPFTRTSKKRKKSYVKTVPAQKIVKFDMGDRESLVAKKLPYQLTLISDEKAQLRHNALEACRQYINKKLDKETNKQYYFKIVPFPHHIQRENKMLTGAGADRMQTGMQLSYGKTAGKAALLKQGSKLFIVSVATPKHVTFTRKLFKQVKPKLPCKTKVLYEEIKE